MKDEIKEIYLSNENSRFVGTHDNMGCVIINGILTKNITYEEYVDIISKAKYFLLVDKDYITNLQEQLHRASLDIQELTEKDIGCPSWCDKLTNSQEQNKRLQNRNIELVLERDRLIENNNAMQEEMARTWKIADDYKSRNEKAIEYINTHYLNANEPELLNILQGDDKNVKD